MITVENFIVCAIYFTVRHCIKADWINDRDQFLYPNDGWKEDGEFQNDCLAFTIFNTNIQSKFGVNRWIPFSESEVNARNNYDSHFMISFLGGKIIQNACSDLFTQKNEKRISKRKFSAQAKAVFKAGKKLWQYYHAQPTSKANASLYDIREFFQGRDAGGKMNAKSGNDQYNSLIADLRFALKTLAEKIQPKVYEYGFLLE